MTNYFEPPVVEKRRRAFTNHRLGLRFRGPGGTSVLKNHDGTYTHLEDPSDVQIEAAAIAYLGAHIYEVDDDEYAALTAAGFGDSLWRVNAYPSSTTYPSRSLHPSAV